MGELKIEWDLSILQLLHLLHRGEIVDSSVLDDRQKDEQEACPQVDVYGFDVRHLWHRGRDTSDDGGHGQNSGDACTHTYTRTHACADRNDMSAQKRKYVWIICTTSYMHVQLKPNRLHYETINALSN